MDKYKEVIDGYIRQNKWIMTNLSINEYINRKDDNYPSAPSRECVEEFAKYNGLDIGVAERFFNRHCTLCGKKIDVKPEIGMNMKFSGEDTTEILCKECFKKEYIFTDKEYEDRVRIFKIKKCTLM